MSYSVSSKGRKVEEVGFKTDDIINTKYLFINKANSHTSLPKSLLFKMESVLFIKQKKAYGQPSNDTFRTIHQYQELDFLFIQTHVIFNSISSNNLSSSDSDSLGHLVNTYFILYSIKW